MNAAAPVGLIVAGGSGRRLGADRPKALTPVAGRPMIAWSLDGFAASRIVGRVIVAIVASARADFESAVAPARAAGLRIDLCAGGETRSHSVRAALDCLRGDPDTLDPEIVLVHDAARPLVSAELIDRSLSEIADADGLVAAAPVTDTIKQASPDGIVGATLDRSTLWAAQTPQVFRTVALATALTAPDAVLAAATDDASLIEANGGVIKILSWSKPNPKITTRADLDLVESLLIR